MILLAQDQALERKKSCYAKIKVSAFVNFEVKHLKMMKKSAVLYTVVAVNFTYLESLTMYRNTCRAGCVSEKA